MSERDSNVARAAQEAAALTGAELDQRQVAVGNQGAETKDGAKSPLWQRVARWRVCLALVGFWEWFWSRPAAFTSYLSWHFTDHIDHERTLINFALQKLKDDPQKLMEWENQRHLTKLRHRMGLLLFIFLVLESAAIFGIVLLRGFKTITDFEISDITLNIIATATIIQVAALVRVVVRSLFPETEGKKEKDSGVAEKAPALVESPGALKASGDEKDKEKADKEKKDGETGGDGEAKLEVVSDGRPAQAK